MPRTGRRFPEGTAIVIDDLQATYLPGDTITGQIVCTRQPVSNPARPYQVRLKLLGRAKSKYIVKTTNGTNINRGRASLFDVDVALKPDSTGTENASKSWSFTVTLPTTTAEGLAQRGDEFRSHAMFLASKNHNKTPIDVTKHPLPAVMYHYAQSELSGRTSEAYVEYFLQASIGALQATLPLFLRRPSTDSPIQDFELQRKTLVQCFKTPRLLGEHADTELTLRQKSSRFFGLSKAKYTFAVKVEQPTIIQLEHPDPLPLKIAIVPDVGPEQTTICPDGNLNSLPPVNMTSIKLQLILQVDIRCPGAWYDHENDKIHDIDIPFRGVLNPRSLPVISASELKHFMSSPDPQEIFKARMLEVQMKQTRRTSDTSTDARSLSRSKCQEASDQHPAPPPLYSASSVQPLHLGKYLSIFIGSSASSTLGDAPVSFKRQLYPTFKTYNIRMSYKLRWKIGLECAGQTASASGEGPLTILPPSEEQEAIKKRELGVEGMKKNYDDLEAGLEYGLQFVGAVLSAVGG